jgi:endo-1,4-beta-xylanase
VEAHVTEMDVYQGPAGAFPDPFEHQKEIFYNVAHTCLQDSNCKEFSVWGVADRTAWHPGGGLADTAPLLFDENYAKKPAYFGVLQALKEGR